MWRAEEEEEEGADDEDGGRYRGDFGLGDNKRHSCAQVSVRELSRDGGSDWLSRHLQANSGSTVQLN